MSDDTDSHLRILEAVLFAASEPLDDASLGARMPEGADIAALIGDLRARYSARGVNLVSVDGRWQFRTAPDVAPFLRTEQTVARKLTRAALETLAIVAYHQPVTRAEIEEIRGVAVSKGTLDTLLEAGWVRPGRRRETPGRPLTWLSTGEFLSQFGLEGLDALPGIEDLKAAGLLDKRPALAAIGGLAEDEADEGARPALPEEDEFDVEPTAGDPAGS